MAQELTANFGANSTKFSKGVQEIKPSSPSLTKPLNSISKPLQTQTKKLRSMKKNSIS